VTVRSLAYQDRPLPIGYGATISQPYIVALMTELLAPAKPHRVLEIGTGSGYQAAILGQLASQVYTIEIVPELARSAGETLRRLGYSNITVREGDGYKGWPEEAPFDRIILTAAPPEVPQALMAQLGRGGRLIAPIRHDVEPGTDRDREEVRRQDPATVRGWRDLRTHEAVRQIARAAARLVGNGSVSSAFSQTTARQVQLGLLGSLT